MQNISDREYIGWSQQVFEQWEEGIYALPMWYRSIYLPKDLWQVYQVMSIIRETEHKPTVN